MFKKNGVSYLKEWCHVMLVSIIIPVYNVAPYIDEAINSVLNQTHKNLEIILIDDGSTDGSGEVCDTYSKLDERIEVIHQEHKGLSAARNAGLDIMTGDVVAFLDSDDAYHTDYVQSMVSAMSREQADIVVCKYTAHDTLNIMKLDGTEEVKPSIGNGRYSRNDALRALVDGAINISSWNKLYRRELWTNIRYPAGHVYEEQQTVLSLFELCKTVYVVDRPLYLYRRRPGSIIKTDTVANVSDLLLAYSFFDNFVKEHTPEMFSVAQERKNRQFRINKMIDIYIRHLGKAEKEWTDFCNDLKMSIIEIFQDTKKEGINWRTQLAYRMTFSYPEFMKLVYPKYRSVRILATKLSGRLRNRK